MRIIILSAQKTKLDNMTRMLSLFCLATALMAFSLNLSADPADTDQEPAKTGPGTGQVAADDIPGVAAVDEMEETEEVNTNDPTAAAISVSAGWEFYNWYEDEIAPGQTRPTGNDNSFNSRFVIPMAKGTWGSPWPIINRFSFSNVEQQTGTSGSGNAEFLTLFIPKAWATGKIGIGPAINLPADEEQFGTKAWRFGFAGVFLENSFEGRLMWGFLLRQVWGKTDLAYHWQENEWLVPLGIRLVKTIKYKRGGIWNAYAEYRTNVVYKDWPGSAASDIIRISASYTFAR